jgi:flagellar basal-body rod protein FlgF
MIYGLYLSATGVVTSNHQTDVIANNLANAESTGFKRQMVSFTERLPESKEDPGARTFGNPMLDRIGGGQLVAPSAFDLTQGGLEQSDNPLDLAITGNGYFAVQDASGQTKLTRNGAFMRDRNGFLVLGTDGAQKVLNPNGEPIQIPATVPENKIRVGGDGTITGTNDVILNRIGVYTVPDPKMLRPIGGSLLQVPRSVALQEAETARVNGGYLERSNVDPAIELTSLMQSQRLMEANANMIRYQDQTLGTLVTQVGRIA